MSNEITLIDQREVLGKDFAIYGDTENPLFLAKDVAELLGNKDVTSMLRNVDEDEKTLRFKRGDSRGIWCLTEDGLYETLMISRKPIAKDFKKQIKEILKAIRKTGHYETPEYKLMLAMNDRILSLEAKIDKRYKPQVNPGYIYKCAWNDYQRITGDESKRGMNGALNDYFGYVPYASQIKPVSVTDWVCKNIGTETLEQFIIDIEDKLIVKSRTGHWVNLGGYACNDYEWAKVLNEFEHRCAYCNASEDDVTLMPEHIIAQSVLSKEHPDKVDLIGNIVPACGRCNESKNTSEMTTWYRRQPYYSEYNLQKIQRHGYKYEI